MQLYDYFRSSAAYRLRIALQLKGIEAERIPVDLVAAEQGTAQYLERNPQGLVPALVTPDQVVLTQSIAIIEWLEEAYPEPALLPATAIERARVRAMVATIACDIHPLNNLRVLNYLVGELGATDEQKKAWYHHWIALGFDALERTVTGAEYCFGDGVTMADVCLVPQMYNARRFKQDLTPFPQLVAICENLQRVPEFASTAPDA